MGVRLTQCSCLANGPITGTDEADGHERRASIRPISWPLSRLKQATRHTPPRPSLACFRTRGTRGQEPLGEWRPGFYPQVHSRGLHFALANCAYLLLVLGDRLAAGSSC